MAVRYKPLMHMMIERDISNAELMRRAKISANIITKIKNGQYIALDKVESICSAMSCTPNDMMAFIPDQPNRIRWQFDRQIDRIPNENFC